MEQPHTLPFDVFWGWLSQHPNCLLRVGTPEAVLYDDDDLHWHLAGEGGSTLVVQVLRGKRVMGEVLIDPELVSYVQTSTGEREGEFHFELISEGPTGAVAIYFFVLVHGFGDDDDPMVAGPVH